MEDTISARYLWDAEGLVDALTVHNRTARGRWMRRYFRAILVLFYAVLTIGLPAWIGSAPNTTPAVRRNSLVILAIVVPFWIWIWHAARNRTFLRRQARRAFRASSIGPHVVDWTIDGERLMNRTPLTSKTMLWPLFPKVVESPRGFLLYQGPASFNWIPGSGFASEAEMLRFARLARDRVADYRVLAPCRFEGKPQPTVTDEF